MALLRHLAHDLAANAIMCEAPSVPGSYTDRVRTVTQNNDASCLALRWSERGGPTILAPAPA